MSDGFLARWAKRKEAVRKGEAVEAEVEVRAPQPSPQPSPAGGRGSNPVGPAVTPSAVSPSPPGGEGRGEGRPEAAPPPTLEEANALTPDSDFARFARPGVAPEVRTAAFKKLFSDPHFNVMDGLDTYIDDYSKPDPIPPAMLKQLMSSKFLGMFEEKETAATPEAAQAREVADASGAQSVAQSSDRTAHALPPADEHADPDLRLQQDDAPGPAGPGAGPR